MILEAFEVASGSVPGRDHVEREGLLIGRNNQDGCALRAAEDGSWFVGVICDGCGSKTGSDLGARLGALFIAAAVAQRVEQASDAKLNTPFFEDVREDVLAELRALALRLRANERFSEFVADNFLFTVIGVLLVRERGFIFSVGDGVFALNGEVNELGPFPGNQPPYLTYSLLRSKFSENPELLAFTVREFQIAKLQSLLLGSDGVMHLLAAASRNVPGKDTAVGPLSQFWTEDRFFQNQDALRRRLALINSTVTKLSPERDRIVTEAGLLPDDTTVIVVRRK